MKQLILNGIISDDSDTWFYDLMGKNAISPSMVKEFLDGTDGSEPIQVLINSQGGSVFAGSEIYFMLKAYAGNVEVIVTGLAASIASVIMMAGDTIAMAPTAQVMIHNASISINGDYRDLERGADMIENTSISLAELYHKKTGKPLEEIRDFMDKETFFTAEKALEAGLVDKIMFDEDKPSLVASLDGAVSHEVISRFRAVMEQAEQLQGVLARLERLEQKQEPEPSKPKQENYFANFIF